MTNADITDDDIRALRSEAAAAGDTITVGLCDNALRFGGKLGARYRKMVSEIIEHARAQGE